MWEIISERGNIQNMALETFLVHRVTSLFNTITTHNKKIIVIRFIAEAEINNLIWQITGLN